jgi:hypothetical protein
MSPPPPINAVPVSVLLQGFDTFSGSARSKVLKGELGPEEANNICASRIVTTKQEIYDYVGVSASLAVSTAHVSVDAKANFISELQTTATSVSVVVMARRAMQQAYTNVALVETAPKDLAEFYRAYGDAFVSRLTTGAEYLAVYTFFATDESTMREVQASLEGSGLAGSVQVGMGATLKAAERKFAMKAKIDHWMRGVDGVAYPDPTPEAITQFAQNFPTLSRTNRVVLSFGTTGYERVPGMPPLGNIVANRSKFEGGAAPGIADEIVRLADVNQKCNAIRELYQSYGYTGDPTLEDKSGQNAQDREAADEWLARLRADPTVLYPAPTFASLKNGYPSATVFRMNGPGWGAQRGKGFDDDSDPSGIPGQSIRSIRIRGGDWVDALTISYTAPGYREWGATHGGKGGQPSRILKLAQDEVITRIAGTLVDTEKVNVVGSLAFTTSKGQELRWPPRPHKARKTFHWDVPQGWRLVGFQGVATEKYLKKLQPILKRLAPARWVPFLPNLESNPSV